MWKVGLVRFLVTLAVVLVACGLQTVVWPAWFGTLVSPPLWLLVCLWVMLYREDNSGIIWIYLYGLFVTSFSAMPLKMFLWTMLITYILVRFVRRRVFWPGLGYFIVVSTATVFVYHVEYLALSRWLEKNSTAWLLGDRFMQVAMTPAFAIVVFHLMRALERIIIRVMRVETGIVHE